MSFILSAGSAEGESGGGDLTVPLSSFDLSADLLVFLEVPLSLSFFLSFWVLDFEGCRKPFKCSGFFLEDRRNMSMRGREALEERLYAAVVWSNAGYPCV